MKQRLSRLRQAMAERGVKALLVSHPVNRRYVTGFTGTAGWGVITSDAAILVTDFRYVEQAKEQASSFVVAEHKGNPFAVIREQCKRLGVSRLAFEQDHLTYGQVTRLKEALEGIEAEPQSDLVESLRRVKEESELEVMRRAAEIADRAFEAILREIRPGKREKEIALKLEMAMREMGAASSAFEIIVASGPRAALPHGVATDRVMEKGDLVTLDFGALYEGYCSDLTRTVVLGQPDEKQREIHGIVLEAQERAVRKIRPGITGREADAVARNFIAEKGYGDRFGHSTGHGLGMEVHEAPSLSGKGETRLEPGMVVTVEPGIYIPGWGGVRIEDDVVVTPSGYEVLTHSPKDLIMID